jgi:hypothetical protein
MSNKKWVITLLSDAAYIKKATNTIIEIRNIGKWTDDIVLMIPQCLELYLQEFKEEYNIILRILPEKDISAIYIEWQKYPQHENYQYIMSRQYIYMKFFIFDTFFKKWDIVFYVDSGISINHPLERIKENCEPDNILYAHSDSYPVYEWKLKRQFNLELFDKKNADEFVSKYNLDIDYFQSTVLIFDTNIIENDTVDRLFELANKYKFSYRVDQGIMNLLFNCEKNIWKTMPLKDEKGFLYDYLVRVGYNRNDYIMLKS